MRWPPEDTRDSAERNFSAYIYICLRRLSGTNRSRFGQARPTFPRHGGRAWPRATWPSGGASGGDTPRGVSGGPGVSGAGGGRKRGHPPRPRVNSMPHAAARCGMRHALCPGRSPPPFPHAAKEDETTWVWVRPPGTLICEGCGACCLSQAHMPTRANKTQVDIAPIVQLSCSTIAAMAEDSPI